ncbi:hypothetical protein HH214_02655 [Mucilaginibacter robiniae]|uniref:SPW repeat-containing integral membrane domain-containing protein n=1 Tax=Mucilaginibacter robiniae TaxID=2728022 RepID=A0A7L5DUQ4_9SPHI|nr:hypothetical protein [Mucilaginibacter robiniae]QJD94855.1 hypothetical protein HH214_02655 [Mucilaginibacter robiniae]
MTTFIPTKVHGVLDYVLGAVITASPWLFSFTDDAGGAALFIPVISGSLLLIMTIFTDHEVGLVRAIPIQLHLAIDVIAGFTLFIAPFLYGFYPHVFLPHVLLGLLLMGTGIFTAHSVVLDKTEAFNSRGF